MSGFFTTAIRLLVILAVPFLVGLSSHAYAVDVLPGCNDAANKVSTTDVCDNVKNASGDNPIIGAISTTITILSIIIGISAVIMIIIAGLSFVTANGDPQAIAKARSSIVYALIGLVIAGIAQAFVAFVLNNL